MTNDNTESPLTAARVAALLGVHRNTVLNMARDGRLTPAGRLEGPTGAWLFTRAEVERVKAAA